MKVFFKKSITNSNSNLIYLFIFLLNYEYYSLFGFLHNPEEVKTKVDFFFSYNGEYCWMKVIKKNYI